MRSARRALGAAAVAFGVAATWSASTVPAAADWQYTRWGMSPSQVKTASDGMATDNGDRTLDAEGMKAELTAPYKGSQLPFTAVFLFDDADQLRYVTLNPVQAGNCPLIMQTLMTNYGKPQFTDTIEHTTTARWQDLNNDNVVVYLDVGGNDCSIQYSKLPNTRNDGTL